MTTSAPIPASVSASWRPSPRDAPVTTATLPVRSNIAYPRNLMVARWPEMAPRTRASWLVIGACFRRPCFALLIHSRQLELAPACGLGSKRHGVAGHDHAREAHRHPSQVVRATGGLGRHSRQDSHLQHPVRDQTRQADRAREIVVEVGRVAVAGRLGVLRNLLAGESHLSFAHEAGGRAGRTSSRITKNAQDRPNGAPRSSVVPLSKVTKRMPRRLVSEATPPREITVSPASGCPCPSNPCSAWSSFAKFTAASSSPSSCGTVTPSE